MKTTMSLQDMFKNFGSLANLILQTSDMVFQSTDSQFNYLYSAEEDKAKVFSGTPDYPFSLPVIVSNQPFGKVFFSAKLNPKEASIFDRLVNEFAGLIEVREKVISLTSVTDSRFQTIFHQSPLSIQICNRNGKTLLVNEAWKKLWAIPEEIIQNYILKDYNMLEDPILEANGVMNYIRKGYSGEVTEVPVIKYDPRISGLEGRIRYVEGLIYPLKDSAGNVNEIVLIHIDVTDKKETDEAQNFLSHVTSILISSLDYDKTIYQIAEACVPDFADACIIDVVEGEKIKRLITKHKDPKKQVLLEKLQKEYPPSMDSPQPSPRVIRSGKAQLMEEINQEIILQATFNEAHAKLISEIGFTSNISVPLRIRGNVIGSLSLLKTGSENFAVKDLDVAVELARRASLAIENSQLFRQSQQATQLRDDFISIASHELKTPITSMKLQFQIAQRLLEKDTSDKIDSKHFRKMTDISIKQLKRITLLVEDLLDVTRISSGKLGMNMQECNISQLVHDLIHQLSFELESLKSLLKVNIQEGVTLVCDQFRLEQVLTNLISNAVRYGENKPFELSLEKTSKHIVIKVKDNGPGISAEAQKRIFKRFERAASKNISGLGLGLFISQQIMLNHNGTLTVESEPGKGSTFIATLPL